MACFKPISRYAVYQIRNLKTGEIYVGSTTNIKERRKAHRRDIKNGRHFNKNIREAVIKYGADSFIFEVIEYFKFPINYSKETIVEHLITRELHYINTLNPAYNICRVSSEYTFNFVTPESTRQRRREIMAERGIEWIREQQKLAAASRVGTHHSLESRITISKSKRKSDKVLYIGMYTTGGDLIKRYTMTSEASRDTGIKNNCIKNQLCGLSLTCIHPQGYKVTFKKLAN